MKTTKRTLVIGIATFDEVVDDTLNACKKASRGEPFGIVNRLDFADEATLFNTLSPKRMQLLRYLRNNGPMSGRALSKQLNRNQKNIQTDIKLLLQMDIVVVNEEGKYLVPWDDITIQLALVA